MIKFTELRNTGYQDIDGNPIIEGDILVGKTDELHPGLGVEGLGFRERDFVKQNPMWNHREQLAKQKIMITDKQQWVWNGQALWTVAPNVKIVGNILVNPDLLLR